jgi:hypothetical protein
VTDPSEAWTQKPPVVGMYPNQIRPGRRAIWQAVAVVNQ